MGFDGPYPLLELARLEREEAIDYLKQRFKAMNRKYDEESQELLLDRIGLAVGDLDNACEKLANRRLQPV